MARRKIDEEIKRQRKNEYHRKYYETKIKAKIAEIKAEKEKILEGLTLEEQIVEGLVKPKVCPICGTLFTSKSSKKKYCCEACKKLAEKMKRHTPEYRAKRREYMHTSEAYKRTRAKYEKSEKFKEVQRKYRNSEKGKERLKETQKRASKNYYEKKRLETSKAICPICNQEFIKDIDHRKYCCEACKELATQIREQLTSFRRKKVKATVKAETTSVKVETKVTENTPREKRIFIVKKNRCSKIINPERIKEYNHQYYLTKTKDKRAKKENILTKICPICNEEFTTTNNHKKYCSKECGKIAQRTLSKEYNKSYRNRKL